jgi:hypothetical protein
MFNAFRLLKAVNAAIPPVVRVVVAAGGVVVGLLGQAQKRSSTPADERKPGSKER